MSKLWMMVGVPGSGKSTYAQKLMAQDENKDNVYVSRDQIRFSMLKEGESYFSKESEVYDEFVRQTNEALKSGKNVIADATFLTAQSRGKFLNALEVAPEKLYGLVMKTDISTCLNRNGKREGRARVPEDKILEMYKYMTKPDRNEGFDYVWEVE